MLKRPVFKGAEKQDIVQERKNYDSPLEAFEQLGDEWDISYEKDGWQFSYKGHEVYVERITANGKSFWSVEVEGESPEEILREFGLEPVGKTMPEIVREMMKI